MTPRPRFIHAVLLPWVALAASGCAPSEGLDEARGLRGDAALVEVLAVFPEMGSRWTEWPHRFEGRHGGTGREVFVTPSAATPKALVVEVPKASGGPVVVRGTDGFAVNVWDDARRGPAELTAAGLTYARTGGGAAFWSARDDGAEEWLYLPEGASSLEVARYRIEGGHPRQHDWAIDVYDDANTPRLTITAPQVFASDGRQVDARMVLEGAEAVVVLTQWTDGPLLVDPVFVAAGNMSGDRNWHDAILLPSGRVMVLGGEHQFGGGSTSLATMELFDPSVGTWSNGPSAAAPRNFPTMTVLNDGRVLVVSDTLIGQQPATQIYDEQANTWSTPAQPLDERYYHQAAKLSDGRVLVVGGSPVGNKAELYDPSANTWVPVSPSTAVQVDRTLQLLPNGDAMIVGGKVAEAYSPSSNAWTLRAIPNYTHNHDGVVVQANGDFVATGGTPVGASMAWGRGTERYDVSADAWTVLPSTAIRRDNVPVTQMKDGSLLLAGGYDGFLTLFSSSEIYSFAAGSWSPGPTLLTARAGHTQTTLLDGRILIAGGYDGNVSLSSAEILTGGQPLGTPCISGLDCSSFFCANSVCCNAACSGTCVACSIASGGLQDGLCGPASNTPCDDGSLCTNADTCASGACLGTPKVCPDNPAECLGPDACDPNSGNCVIQPLVDGTPCATGACVGGACIDAGTTGTGVGGAGGQGGQGGDANQGGGGNGRGGSGGAGDGGGGGAVATGGGNAGGSGEGGSTGGAGGNAGAGGSADTGEASSTTIATSASGVTAGGGFGKPEDAGPGGEGCDCNAGESGGQGRAGQGAALVLASLLVRRRRRQRA